MESFQDSNCTSLTDSFSLYERYMRTFNVVDSLVEGHKESLPATSNNREASSKADVNISIHSHYIDKQCETADYNQCDLLNATSYDIVDKYSSLDTDFRVKVDSPCTSPTASLLENSSATVENSLLNDKSDPADVLVSSEDFKPRLTTPTFITSTMENSNNAVDSVPLFCNTRPSESVFKLPIRELSFNGTLKHVQQLKPIVDPISALSSSTELVNLREKWIESEGIINHKHKLELINSDKSFKNVDMCADVSIPNINRNEKTESTGDSQYEEINQNKISQDEANAKSNTESTYSSLEASFDSGVRSPDMFSDGDDDIEPAPEQEPFWRFLKSFEDYDKRKITKIEEVIHGVLPPPSVTTLKTDVTEMLKKYYCFLPVFSDNAKSVSNEENCITPTKRVSFIEIPEQVADTLEYGTSKSESTNSSLVKDGCKNNSELNISNNDKSIHLQMSTETEALHASWPEVLKCRYYDVYYNVTKYSEKCESLLLRYAERYVGVETDTSVNIHSGGFQSPSSASKRKALRLRMAQAKSPGRRLSHLARRRQAFCSAATINEKVQASTAKMVLIDKNFFPHRKLINSLERKSPRIKRTPTRKTPGKHTPGNTPKTRSGGSSKKKAMRRLLMDPETLTRSQPSRETMKRALFISPENRKSIPAVTSNSVPINALKTRRALFGSPDRAETKSCDGTRSDQFMKRKRDALDDDPENSRSKIAKSLSFGGDTIGNSQSTVFSRRASEMHRSKNTAELNETHKKKLLWAVSEALRVHGWRMSSPGFRDKASALARLTRRLLALPPHAARLASPRLSTSDTMLRIARLYVFAIIQGRSVEECFEEEKMKIANESNTKITGYISAQAYQQLRARQLVATSTSQIKENSCSSVSSKQEQPKSCSKNVLQDKLVNIEGNSNSSSGLGSLEKSHLGLFHSNSMPSFEEAAKMRARRQITFDSVDFHKR